MPKYEVITPWHGVERGQRIELESLSPALEPNVRLIVGVGQDDQDADSIIAKANAEAARIIEAAKAEAKGILEAATPKATSANIAEKGEIAKRLKELKIDFDGRKSAEELAALLPDGDPLKG